MSLKRREKTGSLNYASVAILCFATTMVVGFSKPQTAPDGSKPLAEVSTDTTALVVPDLTDTTTNTAGTSNTAQPPLAAAFQAIAKAAPPAQRPYSFSTVSLLQPVIAGVDARTWIDASFFSPDRARHEMTSLTSTELHGVGFPDIRTYRMPRRSPFADPLPWSSMIAWRKTDNESGQSQPIAKVRCMGLSPQAVARRADRYDAMIQESATKYGVSVSLIKAVITEESCFNNKALSPVGAQGLMQLMPDTASWLNVADPHDPVENLSGGVKYLASLQDQFETMELALAAYNAGPGNVRRYGGVPPFAETQAYVQKVQSHFRRYSALSHVSSR